MNIQDKLTKKLLNYIYSLARLCSLCVIPSHALRLNFCGLIIITIRPLKFIFEFLFEHYSFCMDTCLPEFTFFDSKELITK